MCAPSFYELGLAICRHPLVPTAPRVAVSAYNPETGLRQWLLTDDLGTFSHSVEDGIISFLFLFLIPSMIMIAAY